jgi:bifunctional non-homologous end joining protein LigD
MFKLIPEVSDLLGRLKDIEGMSRSEIVECAPMKPISTPSFVEPMKAFPVQNLPEGEWLYEVKHDGYRASAFKDGKDLRLVSRNKKAFDYPQLLNALKLLPADRVILDGEIVALDEKGRSSFQLLQVYKISEQRVPLIYYVFDLLFVDGKDLRKKPLSTRRKLLADTLKKAPPNIRLSEGLQGSKEDLLRVAQEFGLEGLVAKRLNSVYESGRRTGAWVKFKITKSQEFVVGGYTLPEASRRYFGSLLVGYQGSEGLLFAVESGAAFPKNSCQVSTHNCKNLDVPLAHLSAYRRKAEADGARVLVRPS